MPDRTRIVSNILGLIGATAGGVFGYAVFHWIAQQNLDALVVPGAMLGLGCGLLARHRSTARGVVCGLAALGLGIYSEWSEFPFLADRTFSYFLTHVSSLVPIKLLMLGLGGILAYSFGRDAGFGRPAPGGKPTVRPEG